MYGSRQSLDLILMSICSGGYGSPYAQVPQEMELRDGDVLLFVLYTSELDEDEEDPPPIDLIIKYGI